MAENRIRPGRSALIFVAFALLSIPFLPLGSNRDSALMRAVFDAGHFPLVAVLTVVCYIVIGDARASRTRLATSAILGVGAALFVELVQPWIGRTSSVRDFLLGMLGVFIAVTGIEAWRRSTFRLRLLHSIVVVGVALVVFRPAWFELQASVWRHRHFPVLADFETANELRLWKPRGNRLAVPSSMELSRAHASSGEASLRIRTAQGQYGGALYIAGRQDWEGFERLAFDLYNPGKPFEFLLRIDDSADCTERDSRFNRNLTLRTGWNSVVIAIDDIRMGPERREMNMREVTQMVFLARRSPRSQVFFLDHVRLE